MSRCGRWWVAAGAALAVVLVTAVPAPAQASSEQAVPFLFNQGVARVPGGWVLSGTNSPVPGTDVLVRTK